MKDMTEVLLCEVTVVLVLVEEFVQEEVFQSSGGVEAVACVSGSVSAVSTTSAAILRAFLFLVLEEPRVLFKEEPVFFEPFCFVPTAAGETGVDVTSILKMDHHLHQTMHPCSQHILGIFSVE